MVLLLKVFGVARERIAVTTRLVDGRLRRSKLMRLARSVVGSLSAAGVLGASMLSNQCDGGAQRYYQFRELFACACG